MVDYSKIKLLLDGVPIDFDCNKPSSAYDSNRNKYISDTDNLILGINGNAQSLQSIFECSKEQSEQ